MGNHSKPVKLTVIRAQSPESADRQLTVWATPPSPWATRGRERMASHTLRHVDPRMSRGLLYRTFANLMGTRVALWISKAVGWRLDPHLLRLTRRRLGLGLVIPTALLETRGARTRLPRRNAVIYFHDRDRVTIVASKAGAPEHPAWFYNARANPDVFFGGQPFRVEIVDDEPSRTRLWALADRVFPPFARYRDTAARTGRTIPILQLVPRGRAREGGRDLGDGF